MWSMDYVQVPVEDDRLESKKKKEARSLEENEEEPTKEVTKKRVKEMVKQMSISAEESGTIFRFTLNKILIRI